MSFVCVVESVRYCLAFLSAYYCFLPFLHPRLLVLSVIVLFSACQFVYYTHLFYILPSSITRVSKSISSLHSRIDPPPFFNQAAMESKKMHHMQQQSNAHLAAQAKLYAQHQQQHHHDYRATQQSPANVFQSHPQYQSLASNFAQVNASSSGSHHHQGSSQQPPPLHVKPIGNGHHGGSGHYNLTEEQASLLRDQMYQSNLRERQHQQQQHQQQMQPSLIRQQPMSHQPVTELQQQYQQLQQAKMQAQMKTQSDAFIQQQRTFAMRQHLNPPVPNAQLHQMQSQQQSLASIPMHLQLQQQQQPQNRSVPPSSLNLTNQFQPANGPMTIMNNSSTGNSHNTNESQYGTNNPQLNHHVHLHPTTQQQQQQQQNLQHYLHQQQQQQSSPDQIIIQQNHPGLVTNQACQTQISGQVHRTKQQALTASSGNTSSVQTTPSSDSTPSSPAHALLDRKKSSGSIALKSPMSKRPANASITLTGWLYKQGSDGLKVWRKRWFVLSEFCLYYYKGPEEEKLLGSVLLPSYNVAACTPDDKIYRKFAFKCEHVNMRTYWLAAETAEVMGQWVRALTAATMMQGSSTSSSDQMSQPSVSSLNHSAENSDSGIHTYQSNKLGVMQNGSGGSGTTPASLSDNGAILLNGGGPQPLYANAPPKPRRATDGGYSSPSPEHSMDRFDASYDSRHLDISSGRVDAKSPNPIESDPLYEVRCQLAKSNDPELAARMQQQLRLDYNKSPGLAQQQQAVRGQYNPDTGYNGQKMDEIYQMRMGGRNQGRMGSTENILRQTNTYPDRNELMREKELYLQRLAAQQQQQQQQLLQQHQQQQAALYPNSADRRTPDVYGRSQSSGPVMSNTPLGRLSTLPDPKRLLTDYEDIYNLEQQANAELAAAYRRPMSPMSNQVAGYFEGTDLQQQIKMRSRPSPASAVPRPHSADFLEYEARNPKIGPTPPAKPQAPRPKSSLDINRTPDNYYYSEENYAEKLRQSSVLKQRPGAQAVPPQPRLVPGTDYQQDMIDYEKNFYSAVSGHQSSARQDYMSPQQEQFMRSASARLPRATRDADERPVALTGRDGERKREESMKRLLEWKQRMLQSPLTRKGGNGMSTVPDRPKSAVHMTQGMLQRSRSETNANAGYNSYSSDDEGT